MPINSHRWDPVYCCSELVTVVIVKLKYSLKYASNKYYAVALKPDKNI